MPPHKNKPSQQVLIGSALCSVAAITLMALAVPSFAAAETKAETSENVTIKVIRKEKAGVSGQDDHEVTTLISTCNDGTRKVDSVTQSKDDDGKMQRTRIILCSLGGRDDAALAKGLAEARASIVAEKELSDDARSKALAALDQEIARLNVSPAYPKQ
jgi:hypothetical protein